jgi:hypothetical protein
VLQPGSHIDRLIAEAVTRSAEQVRAAERADLARRVGEQFATVFTETLVLTGILQRKS